jgi:hypothetical protein
MKRTLVQEPQLTRSKVLCFVAVEISNLRDPMRLMQKIFPFHINSFK